MHIIFLIFNANLKKIVCNFFGSLTLNLYNEIYFLEITIFYYFSPLYEYAPNSNIFNGLWFGLLWISSKQILA